MANKCITKRNFNTDTRKEPKVSDSKVYESQFHLISKFALFSEQIINVKCKYV